MRGDRPGMRGFLCAAGSLIAGAAAVAPARSEPGFRPRWSWRRGQGSLTRVSPGSRYMPSWRGSWGLAGRIAGLPGPCHRHRRRVRPRIPGFSPGGLGPHLTSSGSPAGFPPVSRLPAGFFPLRPPSPGFPSSGVLRFVPFGRCPVPVPPRFPSGFPFPWAMLTVTLPRGGSAGVGPGRQGPRSPVLPRPPRPDARSARTADRQRLGTIGCRERRTSPRPNRPDRQG